MKPSESGCCIPSEPPLIVLSALQGAQVNAGKGGAPTHEEVPDLRDVGKGAQVHLPQAAAVEEAPVRTGAKSYMAVPLCSLLRS